MRRMILNVEPIPADQIAKLLNEHGILINRYAEEYFSHPLFSSGRAGKITVIIASLQEMGMKDGATLNDLLSHMQGTAFKPCSPDTGLFLRLAWTDQPQSRNTILSGTHTVPDQAVTVLSEILEPGDDFPKGLYLRNVDGRLWLRGYVCDAAYRFPGDALFAFEA